MKYENFKKIIEWQIAHHVKINEAYKLKIDLMEAFDEQERVIDALWSEVLVEEGADWLNWYLYEKNGISGNPRKDITANDGREICKDLKGLYNYLVKNKFFK